MINHQFAAVDFNTAATQTVIPASSTGRRIFVIGYVLLNGVATAQTVQFKSGANLLGGVMALPSSVGGGVVAPVCSDDRCWFYTDPGAALSMVMSAGTQVGGHIVFAYGG